MPSIAVNALTEVHMDPYMHPSMYTPDTTERSILKMHFPLALILEDWARIPNEIKRHGDFMKIGEGVQDTTMNTKPRITPHYMCVFDNENLCFHINYLSLCAACLCRLNFCLSNLLVCPL